MELIPLTAENRKAWDEFCLLSPDAWFWHTADWLDFNLAYRLELNARSLSFLCVEGTRILAIVPLLLTHHEQDSRKWKAFSLSGNALPSPALIGGVSSAKRDDILSYIFSSIEDLAEELGVSHSRFGIEALRPSMRDQRYAPHNFLLRYDFIDCSFSTQLIDLRLSLDDLKAGLRRNHQRSIERGSKLFKIRMHSGPELTNAKFDEYVEMHARAAGRITRSRATFDMMRKWIQSGRGLFVEALTNDDKSAGFELYIMYKGAAYGLSACNEPEYEHLPIRHLIEWESMIWMRDHGVDFYEIGHQHFGATPYFFADPKLLNISLFKSGFGGVTVPWLYGERFYSVDHWRAEQKLRNERFVERYRWNAEASNTRGQSLLDRLNHSDELPKKPACRPEESTPNPIPDLLLDLAGIVLRDNPDAVQRFASGNDRVLGFLVGQALRRAGSDQNSLMVRRAVEWHLAQIMSKLSCESRES